MIPIERDRMKTIGPKLANSIPRLGALASAIVPKILFLVKYPEPVVNTFQELDNSRYCSSHNKLRKMVPPTTSVPRTNSQGLSRKPVVMKPIARVNTAMNIRG